MEKKREIWVDDVKVIACVLVAMGHFFQSMIKAGILPENNLYGWFEKTIYYYHVPLFFICSGYLYQRYSVVDSMETWKNNVLKKLLVLGVPYFTFSFATWFLKTVFSGTVNDEIGGLFGTLFLEPTSPYWYLYCLFFLFLITPTFRNLRMAAVGFVITFVMKAVALTGAGTSVYAVSTVLSNEIWFVLGMCMSVGIVEYAWRPVKAWIGAGLGAVFLGLSVLLAGVDNGWVSFLLGVLACAAVVELVGGIEADRQERKSGQVEDQKQNIVFAFLSKYTMPIFVMHTLFAAPLRAVLLKAGVENGAAHVALGILISFIGPIVAAEIMKKTKVLEFFLYPGKFVRMQGAK